MNEMNDEYFMQQALRQAQLAFDEDEVPIGAVVVINNKVAVGKYFEPIEPNADVSAIISACAVASCNFST